MIVLSCLLVLLARTSALRPTQPLKSSRASITQADIVAADEALFRAHGTTQNDQMNALFEPSPTEQSEPLDCLLSGETNPLPADLPPGCLLRIGPNPQPGFECPSFLDGDGMVHAITVPPQRPPQGSSDGVDGTDADMKALAPKYSRTYVRAKAFALEEDAGGNQLFSGTLVAPRGFPMVRALAGNALASGGAVVQKDTANTALPYHGGRLLALMEQARPTELAVSKGGAVRTVDAATNLGGAVPAAPVTGGALSAHHRVDPSTGDLVSLTYSTAAPPFVRHDVFGPDGALRESRGVDTPLPVMVHDLAITRDHTLLLDLPMTVRIRRVLSDRFPVEFEPQAGARIGAIPRSLWARAQQAGGQEASGGHDGEVVWCDVDPCVVLHTCNAYARDEDGCVVLTAPRALPKGPQSFICEYTPSFLYEWVLDFGHAGGEGGREGGRTTGRVVSERYLSDLPIEFPVINPAYHGRAARWCYAIGPASAGGPLVDYGTPSQGILIDGLIKLDLSSGATVADYRLPAGFFVVSEPTYVAREASPGAGGGAKTEGLAAEAQAEAQAEDDGYILLVVSEVQPNSASSSGGRERPMKRVPNGSKLLVFDAAEVGNGPVAELPLPADVPYGLHSCYVPWSGLAED